MGTETSYNLNEAVLSVLQDNIGKGNVKRTIFCFLVWKKIDSGAMPRNFDRMVRLSLAELSTDYPIISSPKRGGYRLATTKEDFEDAIRQYYSRAMKCLKRMSCLKTQSAEYGADMLPGFESLESIILEMEKMK